MVSCLIGNRYCTYFILTIFLIINDKKRKQICTSSTISDIATVEDIEQFNSVLETKPRIDSVGPSHQGLDLADPNPIKFATNPEVEDVKISFRM